MYGSHGYKCARGAVCLIPKHCLFANTWPEMYLKLNFEGSENDFFLCCRVKMIL